MCDLVNVDDISTSITSNNECVDVDILTTSNNECIDVDDSSSSNDTELISEISTDLISEISTEIKTENCINVDAEINSENKYNIVIPINLHKLYSQKFNYHCVNIAALFNYKDDKDVTQFGNIYLPEISITYHTLISILFCNFKKTFSEYIVNKIWQGIRGLSLINEFLKVFEEKSGFNREQLITETQIKLSKECAQLKKSFHSKKIIALSLDEFNNALESIEQNSEGNMSCGIVFHLYSETLRIGIKCILRFDVRNVPNNIRGIMDDEDSIVFDFSKI
jgi:hypothetical protein